MAEFWMNRPAARPAVALAALCLWSACVSPQAEGPLEAPRDPARLLAEDGALDDPATLPLIPAKTSTIYRAEEGEWQFNLHSYVAWFDGEFWAVWSSGRADEDSGRQLIRYARSSDGHSWSESAILADDPDGDEGPGLWIARGVYAEDGKLFALGAYNEGARETDAGRESWHGLRLMQFEWTGEEWVERGVLVDDCMNNYPPRRAGDHLLMTCRNSRTAMRTAVGDVAGKEWTVTPLPAETPPGRLSEPSWYAGADSVLHLLFRDSGKGGYLYHAVSEDQGVTWSGPVQTNYPDATSKNIAGRLSDGRYFLINNPINATGPSETARRRSVLGISFSEDGWSFSAPRALVNDPPAVRFPGHAKGPFTVQYPHFVERDGSLFVIYSTNKEDIQISEYRIEDLR